MAKSKPNPMLAAFEAKIRAERRLKGAEGDVNLSRAEMALRKALVRIEVAKK